MKLAGERFIYYFFEEGWRSVCVCGGGVRGDKPGIYICYKSLLRDEKKRVSTQFSARVTQVFIGPSP